MYVEMKVGIGVFFQHSFFSSGVGTLSWSLAEAIKALGHTPIFVNFSGENEWYEDVQELKDVFECRQAHKWTGDTLDVFIDINGIIVAKQRRNFGKHVVIFLRKPFYMETSETLLYPVKRPIPTFEDCDAVWTWAHHTEQDIDMIRILSKCPVYRIPFVWSSKPTSTFGSTRSKWEGSSDAPWEFHTVESNTSMTSSCTIPLVGVAHAKTHTSVPMNRIILHNTDALSQEAFFKDNILNHSQRVGLEIQLGGRTRCADLRTSPKSCIVAHMRFTLLKPAYLDCIWNGIPTIHNSPLLNELGYGLERFYYEDNSIIQLTKAIETMNLDFQSNSGFFAPGVFETLRTKLETIFGVQQCLKDLEFAIQSLSVKQKERVLKVGFCDLWDNANTTYNFWTLLLTEAGRHLSPPVRIEPIPTLEGIDILFFGPFGETWKTIDSSIPKFFITGENSNHREGNGVVMNFGFEETNPQTKCFRFPLWMQYIDWFGANQERLVNPKTLPVDAVLGKNTEVLQRERKKFCAFIVSNPNNPVRNNAFHWLSQYKQVDSAGRLFNTMGPELFTNTAGGGGGELAKWEMLKSYKFSLTYENSRTDGYITEKFLAAKAAGAIPIYWGALDVHKDFTEGSFLNANSLMTPDELINAVQELDTNEEAWRSMALKPAFDGTHVREILSQVAKCVFERCGILTTGLPSVLGGASTKEALALGIQRGDISHTPATRVESIKIETITTKRKELATRPLKEFNWNGKTLIVSFATQKYLEPLLKWLDSIDMFLLHDLNLSVRVYLGDDINDVMANLVRSQHPDVEVCRLPTKEVLSPTFPDLWEPHHFAWKLWIYQELVQEVALQNTLVWYMDSASIIVRWPTEWLNLAKKHGICMLEDPQQKNDQWCSDIFRKSLTMTSEELGAQQVVGGIMAFMGGASLPWKLFTEAWVLGQQRHLIVGPKWAGFLPDGRPFGHRHDQSILSLLRIRRNVPVYPLYNVYCDESLRRTYKSGASLYIHRGNFKEHIEFAPHIGEVHLINLNRRPDRIQRFKQNHEEWTKQVCLRPAFDGRELHLTPALARLFAPNDFYWKKAVTGCALSHLSLWNELASEKPSCENYLILEDDVKFKNGWLNIWNEASKHIPEDYDVLYLGGVLPPNRKMYSETIESVNHFWGRILPNQLFGQKEPSRYFHFCNYAYILSRNGAKKILEDIQTHGGYYTSADHMICNRVDTLNHYVLHPQVAGCYQDDDPKYQASAFNDFSRIDGFDSDLWNNDERFTHEEILEQLKNYANTTTHIPIQQALCDASRKEPPGPPKSTLPKGELYTLGDHRLVKGSLLEYDWLNTLFGGRLDRQTQLPIDHEPLSTCPTFVCMKPHFQDYSTVFQRYESLGVPFRVLHLSDEHASDPIHWYSYSACKEVYRIYGRSDIPCPEKIIQLPLGPCRTLVEGTPLHTKELAWSFFGTGWKNRKADLAPLMGIGPHEVNFFESWMNPEQLSPADYSSMCAKSHFMPCPGGQNQETFRFYESLEHGSIPLYIKSQGTDLFYDYVTKHLPLIILDSWENAKKAMLELVREPTEYNAYRKSILLAWAAWKKQLIQQCS